MAKDKEIKKSKNTEEKFEVVYRTYNRTSMVLAKTLLDDNKIDYYIKNETSHYVFGTGVLLKGHDPGMSPMEIIVSEKYKDKAIQVLKNLEP